MYRHISLFKRKHITIDTNAIHNLRTAANFTEYAALPNVRTVRSRKWLLF